MLSKASPGCGRVPLLYDPRGGDDWKGFETVSKLKNKLRLKVRWLITRDRAIEIWKEKPIRFAFSKEFLLETILFRKCSRALW